MTKKEINRLFDLAVKVNKADEALMYYFNYITSYSRKALIGYRLPQSRKSLPER